MDWFMEQAFNGGQNNPRLITEEFMGVLCRYEANSRGSIHSHCTEGIDNYNFYELYCYRRSAIEDGAEEIGYEDIIEMNERRKQRLAGEDASCKHDNKTYTGGCGDDGGSGGNHGGGYGGWKRGGFDYTVPSRT